MTMSVAVLEGDDLHSTIRAWLARDGSIVLQDYDSPDQDVICLSPSQMAGLMSFWKEVQGNAVSPEK